MHDRDGKTVTGVTLYRLLVITGVVVFGVVGDLAAAQDTRAESSGRSARPRLQPTLGGGYTLRGFRTFRFRDRSVALAQAEYRWRINEFVTGALFYETGAVARRIGDLGCQRAVSKRERTSVSSSITARARTIPTIFILTSTAASCAATGSLPPGWRTMTRARSTP